MYVCTYVCMYVCMMYVCMYVYMCMYIYTYRKREVYVQYNIQSKWYMRIVNTYIYICTLTYTMLDHRLLDVDCKVYGSQTLYTLFWSPCGAVHVSGSCPIIYTIAGRPCPQENAGQCTATDSTLA